MKFTIVSSLGHLPKDALMDRPAWQKCRAFGFTGVELGARCAILINPASGDSVFVVIIEVSNFGKLVKNDQDAPAILPCLRARLSE